MPKSIERWFLIATTTAAVSLSVLVITILFVHPVDKVSTSTNQVLESLSQQCGPVTFGVRGDLWDERYDLDENNDTVVTGDELCRPDGGVCLFTQTIEYNLPLQDGQVVQVAQPIMGCFGGDPLDDFEQHEDRVLLAWCCYPDG